MRGVGGGLIAALGEALVFQGAVLLDEAEAEPGDGGGGEAE